MLALVILQVALGVYVFINTGELANAAQRGLQQLWNDMLRGDRKSIEAIHGIQRGLQCCGMQGPLDWTANMQLIPTSCCAEEATSCNILSAFSSGCAQTLHDAVSGSGKLIAWIAIGFAVFEVKLID